MPMLQLQDDSLVPPASDVAKRTHQDRATNTPPISPVRKKSRLQTQSSIRQALESKETPQGLLLYFHKATKTEHQEWLLRSSEEVAERADNEHWQQEKRIRIMEEEQRLKATNRKCAQRGREKKLAIARGLWSPGGRKKKV